MNCREFEDRIDQLATDAASPEELESARLHAAECNRCGRLLGVVRSEIEPMPAEVGDRLTKSIMERTAGAACDSAQERLCDWLDGSCESGDEEMLAQHVDHCAGCRDLCSALVEIGEILPELACIDPGAGFTADVLRATTGIAVPLPTPLAANNWWIRLVRRPRFVWEAAYAGAIMVMLLLGHPAIREKAFAWPQRVTENGDRLLAEAGSAISERTASAQISFAGLQEKGRAVLRTLSGLPGQTTRSLRAKAVSWYEAWESPVDEHEPADRR